MANYQILKADIDEKIYENAQQKITGENLNSVLNAMVATLGAEYQFAGVATIDTNPETSDAKVFYIANGKGIYTHFGNIDVTEDDVVILYYDTSWHKVATGIASQAKLSELDKKTEGIKQITDQSFDKGNLIISINSNFNDGYLDATGEFVPHNNYKTSDFVELISTTRYKLDITSIYEGETYYVPDAACLYNENKEYIGRLSIPIDIENGFTPINGTKYIRVCSKGSEILDIALYPLEEGRIDLQINNDIKYQRMDNAERNIGLIERDVEDLTEKEIKIEDDLSQIVVPSRIDKWNLLEYEGVEYLDRTYHDNDDIDKTSYNEFVIKNIPIGLAKGSVLYVYSDWGSTNYQSDGYNNKYACRGVAFYRKDKSLISSNYAYTFSPITIPNDAEYATLTMMYSDASTLDKGVIWVTKRSKNDHIDITYKAKAKDKEYPSNYIHARRAIVSFTLDGDYDMNQAMKSVFDSHGMKCGVAPVYTNMNQYVGIARYLEWQDEGFEIMTHGGVILGDLPEEEAIRKIKESYYTMKDYGFDVKGYISSSGYADPKFIPYIADLYDWAVTTNDHAATSESCYEFGVDDPYKLWRYSMQLATLQQMKNAIDRAIEQRRVVAFYGHAKSDELGNFTSENLDALLMYCEEKGIRVMTPTDAIKDFFSLRYNDIISH